MATGQNIVDLGYDIDKLSAQQKVVVSYFNQTLELADQLDRRKIAPDLSGQKDVNDALDKQKKIIDDLQSSYKKYSNQLDEIQKIEQQEIKTYEKRQAAGSAQAKSLAEEKELLRQRNAEIKNMANVNTAAEGSIKQMQAALALLTAQYDKMGAAERESAVGTELLQKIKGQDAALKQLEASTGRHQRNVGNYTGAINILEKSLQEVKMKMDDLTKSGNGNSSQMEKLQAEEQLLGRVLDKNKGGFASLTMEVRQNERALATMYEQGMQGTTAFSELQMATANAKRELTEFQQNEKLLSSTAPILQSMTIAAKGLSGAYALGAGAAAIFADGDEKVEKELNKLVAIMTVLQGLNEIHELLEKKGAIAAIMNASAQKIKNFIQTGNIATTREQAAANIMAAESEEVMATATRATSGALVGLRTALIATGIGALLVLLPTVVMAMNEWSKQTKETAEQQKMLDNIQAESQKNILKERIEMEALISVAKDDKKSKDERGKAVEEINQKLKPYNEQISLETINTDKASKAIDDYNNHLQKKALANAYMTELEKLYVKQIEDENSELSENIGYFEQFWNYVKSGGNGASAAALNSLTAMQNIKEKSKKDKEDIDLLNSKFLKSLKDGTAELDFSNLDKGKDSFKDIQEKIQGQIIALTGLKNAQNQIASNEKNTTETRIAALEQVRNIETALAELESQKAKAKKDISEQEIKNIDADLNNKKIEIKTNYNKQIQKLENDNVDYLRKLQQDDNKSSIERKLAFEEEVFNSDKHSLDERLAAFDEYVKNENKLLEAELAQRVMNAKSIEEINALMDEADNKRATKSLSDADKRISIVENGYKSIIDKIQGNIQLGENDAELLALQYLNQEFKSGKISADEYQKKLADIKKTAETTSLNLLIDDLQAAYDKMDKTTDAAKSLLGILGQLKTKKELNVGNDELEKQKKINDAKAKTKDLEIQLGNEVKSSIQSLVDDGYQQELNAIQHKKDLQDEAFSAELQNIEKSNLSQQDKAAQIARITALQRATDKQLEREQRDIKNRQARADRAFSVASIVENTAIAIVSALKLPPPFNFIEAGLIGAIGAIQLATVLSKPIPQYAEGTDDHPGGLGVVGEGKYKEKVTLPSGESFVADRTMLLNMPAHTTVQPITTDDINTVMYSGMINKTAQILNMFDYLEAKKSKQSDQLAQKQISLLEKLVAKEQVVKVGISSKYDPAFERYVDINVKGLN